MCLCIYIVDLDHIAPNSDENEMNVDVPVAELNDFPPDHDMPALEDSPPEINDSPPEEEEMKEAPNDEEEMKEAPNALNDEQEMKEAPNGHSVLAPILVTITPALMIIRTQIGTQVAVVGYQIQNPNGLNIFVCIQ